MEIKLLQEFDYSNKNLLFNNMPNMNDAIVKELREEGNSLYIILHEFDSLLDSNGETIWSYKELEIEYEHIDKDRLEIWAYGKNFTRMTPSEIMDWIKKEKVEIEMNDWIIKSNGVLYLKLIVNPNNWRKKSRITEVEIQLYPKKIIFRWKS